MMKHIERIPISASLVVALLLGCVALPTRGQDTASQDNQSLGDIARQFRENKPVQVQVTTTDAKQLFSAVDEILDFASKDTGYPKHVPVKRKLVSRDEVDAHIADALGGPDKQTELTRSEVVLKKFGLLPPDFALKEYVLKNYSRQIGGYYSHRDKTMYLLNWVALEAQRPIMAHELTHALQDQNYGLTKFVEPADRQPQAQMTVGGNDESERFLAHRAIVEGQAMLVYGDFLTKGLGIGFTDVREARAVVVNRLKNYDPPVVFHRAPRVLSESGAFPYREGVTFELEVLEKTDRQTAFAGVFARPPRSTYEIMQPEAYLKHAAVPEVKIPDLSGILGDSYEAYDSGVIGQLDARIMAREFGRENDIYVVADKWNGGSYVAVKRRSASNADLKPADLALLYVSRWKTQEAAQRFAEIYAHALAKRVRILKQDTLSNDCPEDKKCNSVLWASRLITDEGPTFVEVWPGNTLIISHSFDESTMSALRRVVLSSQLVAENTSSTQRELSSSLYASHSFTALTEEIRTQIAEQIEDALATIGQER
jgi:hypothetical protein